MPRKAGVIVIDLALGQARFTSDINQAEVRVKSFGSSASESFRRMGEHGVSEAKATSSAMKVLEGNFVKNIRAADGFLEHVVGLGPVLKAAFPIIGAVAFAGVIFEVGEKVYEFFKKVQEAPAKMSEAFRALNAPLRMTNDELQVTNDRLANDIAKLEGRRQNTLKLALDEARVAADKLADALDNDLRSLEKLMKEESVGRFVAFFTNQASTHEDEEQVKKLKEKMAEINAEGSAEVRAAKSKEEAQEAQSKWNDKALKELDEQINAVQKLVSETEKLQRIHEGKEFTPRKPGQLGTRLSGESAGVSDQSVLLRERRGRLANLSELRDRFALTAANTALVATKEEKTAGRDNAKLDRPFENKIAKLQAEIKAAQYNLDAAGLDGVAKVIAKAHGDAAIAIEEVIKANKNLNVTMSAGQKDQIEQATLTRDTITAEEQWQTKLATTTANINAQVQAHERMTAAIGKGYEAVKAASVETAVIKEVGAAQYNDPNWMKEHAGDVIRIRTAQNAAEDAANVERAGTTTDTLSGQIELEKSLAIVQYQGAEAIRLVTLAYKLRDITAKHGLEVGREQIRQEIELYKAQRANLAAAEIAKINQRIEAVKKLSAAVLEGAEAERKATLENKYAAMKLSGESDETIERIRREDQLEHELKITAKVGARLALYKDHLADLDEELAKLREIQVTEKNRLDIERVGRILANERLQILAQQSLALRGARDGVRAFFLDMQQDAKSTAATIYEALHTAFDRLTSELAKLATGQKTSFGRMFQEIGGQVVEGQIKGMAQKGLGSLGKVFPKLSGITDILGGKSKPLGNKGDPIYTRSADSIPGIGGAGGLNLGGVFGGGDKGGGIFSFLAGFGSMLIPHAAGGPVSPGSAYLVGERGPEPFFPNSPGTIMSNASARRTFGSGGAVYYQIDARGTDPVLTEARTRAGILAAHRDAVGTAVRVSADRLRRVPSGVGMPS